MPLNVKLHLKSSVEEMRPQDGTSGKRKGSMSGVLLRRLKGKKQPKASLQVPKSEA